MKGLKMVDKVISKTIDNKIIAETYWYYKPLKYSFITNIEIKNGIDLSFNKALMIIKTKLLYCKKHYQYNIEVLDILLKNINNSKNKGC